ncbi:MAG: biotin/lipoyl-containing protein, partial [Burkholderiaceae bacterium]
MAEIEVKVPDIGDFADVGVIELLVGVGDRVEAEQSLVTVESDKASMELPSSSAGVVKALRVKVGDRVSEGSVLLVLEAEAAGGVAEVGGKGPKAAEAPAVAAPVAAPAVVPPTTAAVAPAAAPAAVPQPPAIASESG